MKFSILFFHLHFYFHFHSYFILIFNFFFTFIIVYLIFFPFFLFCFRLNTIPPMISKGAKPILSKLFDSYVPSVLPHLRRNFTEPLPTVNNCLVEGMKNNYMKILILIFRFIQIFIFYVIYVFLFCIC